MGKRLLFALATLAILLLQLGNCAPDLAMDAQAMQCCHSMPCTPSNHGPRCCKDMLSASAPSMLPGHHAAVHAPAVAKVKYPILTETLRNSDHPYSIVEAIPHSPPDLYTLHASLLI